MTLNQSNNQVYLNDKVKPEIISCELNGTNTIITVTFNETVYSTSRQTGTVTVEDFNLTLRFGNASLLSTTPNSISISNDNKTFALGFILVDNPSGTS